MPASCFASLRLSLSLSTVLVALAVESSYAEERMGASTNSCRPDALFDADRTHARVQPNPGINFVQLRYSHSFR